MWNGFHALGWMLRFLFCFHSHFHGYVEFNWNVPTHDLSICLFLILCRFAFTMGVNICGIWHVFLGRKFKATEGFFWQANVYSILVRLKCANRKIRQIIALTERNLIWNNWKQCQRQSQTGYNFKWLFFPFARIFLECFVHCFFGHASKKCENVKRHRHTIKNSIYGWYIERHAKISITLNLEQHSTSRCVRTYFFFVRRQAQTIISERRRTESEKCNSKRRAFQNELLLLSGVALMSKCISSLRQAICYDVELVWLLYNWVGFLFTWKNMFSWF